MRHMTLIDSMLKRYPLVSDQVGVTELRVILRELGRVLDQGTDGDVVEFGCYEGTTALFLQRLLGEEPGRKLFLYDSFQGLPEKTVQDDSSAGDQFKAGELLASKQKLINNFKHAGLSVPRIYKAWFKDLKPGDVPDKIAFAYLDGDYYDSIIDSLRLVWPRLSKDGIIVVDDYQSEALPGVRRALEAWSRQHALTLSAEASLAIVRRR